MKNQSIVKLHSPFTRPNYQEISFVCKHLSELVTEFRESIPRAGAEKRRVQYKLGRLAAKEALLQIGVSGSQKLASGEQGEPLWPIGATGSISHCREFAVAAASSSANILSLGIDVESTLPPRDIKVFRRILYSESFKWVEQSRNPLASGLLLFSGKESIYKAFFQATKSKLNFNDALYISLKNANMHSSGCLQAELQRDVAGYHKGFKFNIYFNFLDTYVITGVVLDEKRDRNEP